MSCVDVIAVVSAWLAAGVAVRFGVEEYMHGVWLSRALRKRVLRMAIGLVMGGSI